MGPAGVAGKILDCYGPFDGCLTQRELLVPPGTYLVRDGEKSHELEILPGLNVLDK